METTEVQTAHQAGSKPIDPELAADIQKFEGLLADHLAGRVDEDAFRVFRLNNGIYGQRQGGHNQMVRIKLPYGNVSAEQLELLGSVADRYSRGWGHITTRQNIQFHFVQLEKVPALLRELAEGGLTTREACGDTVRNVMGCHLAGACPYEVLDISPWAEATFRHFLHHPYAQRLPRKFKINFSGCMTDCGQAMFNDVGVVAVSRPRPDGSVEPGFRVFMAGGLGANPHPAQALEEFTPREELLPTIEAILRTFDHFGNRYNKLRARLKWVVDELGIDELRRRVLRERQLLLASSSWPGGIPAIVEELGDAPAGVATGSDPTPLGVPVTLRVDSKLDSYKRWESTNVVIGVAKGTVSAIAYARLGDITSDQFRALGQIVRDFGLTVRATNRQNLAFRDLTAEQLPELYRRLEEIGMAEPGAELARDVVACPGADTCNLAVTQSRGLADDIGRALEEAGLADVGGVRINISGCTNSCGQHHVADIGFHGAERRAHGRPAPGYQLLLGGHVGDTEINFGQRALRLPAKAAAEATVRLVGRFAEERQAGEPFASWMERAGGAKALGTELKDLDEWPDPEERPDYYIDFDETGPFTGEVGEGECAAS
ncbi:MAG TPA: nitrite/sulfite reductase [Acidimicrobiales bacterium]|nr:nitrite/sulfite reductase [Acidimicrobiales bacterium]